MHGGVHPREVGAPHWPRVARDGVRKKQLLEHDIIRLAGCVIIAIIIKGHPLRRACLQPVTNTQDSKPRPPTSNARSKGKLENKIKHCSKLSTG